MLKASNLRDMSVDELELTLSDLAKEIYKLVNEMKRANKPEKPHMLRQKRKEKARLLTILHEKQSFNS
ncbi:MAG: 50S ribosomal protein L29 [Parachlamydiaceae bacterium]|nr:50S ribosomal protein L29 [Parachlamydiaceae bacterium]